MGTCDNKKRRQRSCERGRRCGIGSAERRWEGEGERGGFDRIMSAEEESEGERRGGGVSDGGRERQGEREKERKSE